MVKMSIQVHFIFFQPKQDEVKRKKIECRLRKRALATIVMIIIITKSEKKELKGKLRASIFFGQ